MFFDIQDLNQEQKLPTKEVFYTNPALEESIPNEIGPYHSEYRLNQSEIKDIYYFNNLMANLDLDDFEQPLFITPNKPDIEIRNNIKPYLKTILDNKDNYKKNSKKIKECFSFIAVTYLENKAFSIFHSFTSLADSLNEADESFYKKLADYAQLNQLIIKFQSHITRTLNYLENVKKNHASLNESNIEILKAIVTIHTSFAKKIQARQARYHEKFFVDGATKKAAEGMVQTIKALIVNDLNKIDQALIVLNQSLTSLKIIENQPSILPVDDSLMPSLASLKNKRIAIFTCSYGTGHKITAQAIKELLIQAGAKPEIYDFSSGAFLGKDRFYLVSKFLNINIEGSLISGVHLFNLILKYQLYSVVNTKDILDHAVRRILDLEGKSGVAQAVGLIINSWSKKQIREALFLNGADHIITTYHMDLNPMLEVAEELGIPLLHIPTDYKMKLDEVFGKLPPRYPYFKSTIPNHLVKETLVTKNPVPTSSLVDEIGIPLRKEFYQTLSNQEALDFKSLLHIKPTEKVLYLSAGGNGQSLPHPKHLANSKKWNIPLHILVIAGKNLDFVKELQASLKPMDGNPLMLKGSNSAVTIQIVENPDPAKHNTNEQFFIPSMLLTKILDIADVSIAKGGGLSVAELLFKGIPTLFDQRKAPFSWELFNINVVIDKGLGASLFNLKDLEKNLTDLLQIPKKRSHHFYFEFSREIFSYTVQQQLEQAEADSKVNNRQLPFIHPSFISL